MIPDPSTTRIIHDTMIAEELVRRSREPLPIANPLPAIRHATARALVRLADRIAPAPESSPNLGAA
jgi:hypothetical protein